ncbi:MAG: hypothetical protein NC079_03110 [Clostridium sp.]|nr:hypothetical protein [Acetatifactor muris]MCM1525879.1 hypothetical protein [Bacteroides sp.]MCM1562581.1 hypothetical protein [Clostridium sp.]
MNKLLAKIYDLSYNSIQILSLAFMGLLFISGFLFTCHATDMTSQQVLTRIDNPLWNILGTAGLLTVFGFICHIVCRRPALGKKILLILTFGWIILLGAVLILFGRTAPAADAWSVYSAAGSLAAGDTSVIHPTDSYLSYYPQQVGLTAFLELLIRVWNLFPIDLQAYHFIKCLYVVLTCLIVYYQYATVHLLWEDDRADCLYLILAGGNLPLIFYSSFVYGEIPSFAALSAGIYLLLRLLQNREEKHLKRIAVCPLVLLTLSVMLRKNSLIILIAVILTVLAEGIKTRRRGLFLFAALCTAGALTILPATQKIYELRAGNTLRSGVPAMSYFAMGMQESSRGNGWYNGFNFDTYRDTGMDTAATSELSRQFMEERSAYFLQHPGYTADFYFHKFLSQWADGTYASRQATLATLGERHPAVESVYTGSASRFYVEYCNLYQNLTWLCCLTWVLSGILSRKDRRLYPWIGLIGAFGGFLFHMIWEANARYIFLYGLLLMPYAARGMSLLSSTFSLGRFRKNNRDRSLNATEKPTTAA